VLFFWRLKKLLKHYALLSDDIFTCFLNPDYPKAVYLFERRIHLQKTKCIKSLLTFEKSADSLSEKCKIIFLIMMDCALLRFRVADHTTFNVCKTELENIQKALHHAFKKGDTAMLQRAIDAFYAQYEQVLQVAAATPLSFLIFIASLRSLAEALHDLSQLLS
jgi:hypothetical protein